MFAALFRILFGLVFAALVAGGVQVLFALTPAELASGSPQLLQSAAQLWLDTSLVNLVFAAPFVFLAGIIAEGFGVRSFSFHALAGIFIALAGLGVLYSGEQLGDPTLANSYAIAAYLTAGFFGGIAYWLVSGRFSGGRLRRKRTERAVAEAEDTDGAVQRAEGNGPGQDGEASRPSVPSAVAGAQSSVPSTGSSRRKDASGETSAAVRGGDPAGSPA